MSRQYRVGILQINPHTLWRKGGGELHAAKYIEHGNNEQFLIEPFDFTRSEQYDVIHYFGSAYQMNEIGKYARAEGIRVVGTPILYPSENNLKYKLFLKFGNKLPFRTTLNLRQELLKQTDALIANSEPEADYISNAYAIDRNKISILGTGVSKSFFDYEYDEKDMPSELKDFDSYALMVGRVTPLKNQLKVANLFAGKNQNLLIVGKQDPEANNYINELKDIVANSANIKWIEGLKANSNELRAVYNQTMCHILWSRTEVAALVNMEAMALSCPAISRGLPTTKSIVKDYGILANTEDELLAKVSEVSNWSKEERVTYTEKAKNYVLEHHTWENIVEKSLDIYIKLLTA